METSDPPHIVQPHIGTAQSAKEQMRCIFRIISVPPETMIDCVLEMLHRTYRWTGTQARLQPAVTANVHFERYLQQPR